MSDPGQQRPKVIDENGLPVLDGDPRGPDGPRPAGHPLASPGFTVFASGEQFLTADGSRPSLRKLLGWRGIAVLAVVVALVIAVAVVSIVAFAFVVPILLLLGLIGAGLRHVRGPAR